MNRRTICRPTSVSGIGLLSQRPVKVRLKPGQEGIVFNDSILATPRRASEYENRTCIGRGRHRIYMIEHLMAACAGLGITDLGVDVEGNELPLGDGSSLLFYHALNRAGTRELVQEAVPITGCHWALDAKCSCYFVAPGSGLRVAVYGWAPGYGPYDQVIDVTPESFRTRLVRARTFGPVEGPVWKFRQRFRLGLPLKRNDGWVFPKHERMPNEPGCHKVLDLLGDLWLLGRPILASIEVCNSNHRMNLALVRELEEMCRT